MEQLSNLSVPTAHCQSDMSCSPSLHNMKVNNDCMTKSDHDTTLSCRRKAEIQLYALLNDPEVSLPASVRNADILSIADVSLRLSSQPFIIERLLNVLKSLPGSDNSTPMSKSNVIKLTRILNSTVEVRALLFFMMLDENGDDHVSTNELVQFLQGYFESIVSSNNNHLKEVLQTIIQRFHLETKAEIDFEEFHSIIVSDTTILTAFSRFTVHPTWFLEPTPLSSPPHLIRRVYEACKPKYTWDYVMDNKPRFIWFIIYALINLGLLIYVVIYRSVLLKANVFIVLARIGGMLLNFNCALTTVLMLKRTILFIRSNEHLRRFLVVDSHIDFHKFIGRFIAVLSALHTAAHMANFGRDQKYPWSILMFTTIPDIGWVGGFASLSGVILCIILAILVICSMEWVRRRGNFTIFYWTHRLYIIFFVFLIIHASNFWKWIIGPLSLFFIEKLYSIVTRYSSRSGRTYIVSATIEQSEVISLTIHRPKNFNFKPGDYININIPSIALYEFHPFTISSGPEEIDVLRVHIKVRGNWTKRVYQRFADISESKSRCKICIQVYRADRSFDHEYVTDGTQINAANARGAIGKKEIVIINGPYSSCARYIFDCKHAILISAGIGVTPYASILSSLMAQFRASHPSREICAEKPLHTKVFIENRRLRKVDFVWVNRDYKSFEWFLKLLRQFEEEQDTFLALNSCEQRFLTIHLYFTKIKDDPYIGHAPLALITQVATEDIFTGLKARTHFGRPKWETFFAGFTNNECGLSVDDINVFFCGPPTMRKNVRETCNKHRFRFYDEKF